MLWDSDQFQANELRQSQLVAMGKKHSKHVSKPLLFTVLEIELLCQYGP